MKNNLHNVVRQLEQGMITTDGYNNATYEELEDSASDFFSDREELNHKNKMVAITNSISNEIDMVNKIIEQQDIINKYGIDVAVSGKEWEGTPYWQSTTGMIMIVDLADDHLCRIPRHLFNHKVVKNADDLPPKIVNEIKKRGFKLLPNCVVIQNK